jgi:SmpA / OmlA family
MKVHSRFLTLLVALVVTLSVAGCGTLKFGTLPKTEALGSLRPGSSTQDDVLEALGKPPGKGVLRVLPDLKPRTIWAYEYEEAEGTKSRQKVLLVYFDGEVFDGYLWFSSVQLMGQAKD